MTDDRLGAGVIGVGTMGGHHARVYDELTGVELVGVSDTNHERAREVATDYGTQAQSRDELVEQCDLVSVAVPTRYHYELAQEAIEHGVHVLVEKPFVSDIAHGRELVELARDHGVKLQVGHVERFNPAVQALLDIEPDLDVIAMDVRRLGPPVERDTRDSVVLDLMIHDIDVMCSLLAGDIETIDAMSAREGRHVTAQVEFDSGVVCNLTASRVTQEKVRDLAITADDCRVTVDYKSQDLQIHRHSLPEFYETDGNLRYRHESIIERPTIRNGEPLKAELRAFVDAIRTDSTPEITGEDALEVLRIARRIDEQATGGSQPTAR